MIGGGPIGCELGQAFARLGTEGTTIASHNHLLPKEEPEAVAVVNSKAALQLTKQKYAQNHRLEGILARVFEFLRPVA
ncbi:MAG: NAD-binding protein [Nodosilinea sp.]